MHQLRKNMSIAAVAAAVAAGACSSTTTQGQASAPEGSMAASGPGTTSDMTAGQRRESRLLTASADVEAIDQAKRVVSLRTDKGQTFEVKVGSSVDLNRVQVGDRVSAKYYDELVLDLRPAGSGLAPSVTHRTVERGGVAEQQATVTAQVVSVDPALHVITVRGPRATRTLYVQDLQLQSQLANVKPQDNITVTYTRALAVSLDPQR
jgi:hypothetical protein